MIKAKTNSPITLAGTTIAPGHRQAFELEVAQLYTHSPLNIPVEVVNGRKTGPTLLVCAAIHGDEINGVEAIRQVLEKINPRTLKGTLIAVPVVNVFGFIQKSRYLPDRRDLNRCFPGSEKGSIAGRMAYQFMQQIVSHCSHVIDLHTGAIYRSNLPQARTDLTNSDSAKMAMAFGAPLILNSAIREGSLRAECDAAGIPVITYEGGEALRFDPLAIAAAVKGVQGVMQFLGMVRKSRKKKSIEPVIASSSSWIRSEQNGIVRSKVRLGDRVVKGQTLALVCAPLGHDVCKIQAPEDGIVIGQQMLPLVNEGDAVYHLAYFSRDCERAEQQIDTYIDDMAEKMDPDELMIGLPQGSSTDR